MKRAPRPDIAAAEAARVGEELREARLSLGASVEDVAERLRINRRYIHALEEGRLKDLPGPAYAVGFVRSYATALGLDPDEAVRRFRDMTGGAASGRNGDLVFPEPVPSRGVPAGALVAVGAVLAVGAYVAWFNWSGSGERVVDAVPPVPARLEQATQEGQRPRPPAPGPTPGTPPPPSANPTQASAAPAVGAAAAPPSAPAAPAAAAAAPRPAPPSPGPVTVQLRARGDSWVQVRDTRANQVILDRVLRNGDTFQVPSREGLVLTTGKAENLEILLNDEPSPVLSGATGVRRGIVLDVDRLRQPETAAPRAAEGQPPARP
ncbi:helix-turn-helix domain-containing protein [Roseomonas sp. HF4]|uniref:helix-turn-helix domain-containing protein n=1 Tax=Roseomonas sp. HF4 TaxID=2562313 RepID=UPI0010C0B181|nr:helix-turn-helix domain-containing protein [Roseomonas sp. HF4]